MLPEGKESEIFERPLRGVGTAKLARLELDSAVYTWIAYRGSQLRAVRSILATCRAHRPGTWFASRP